MTLPNSYNALSSLSGAYFLTGTDTEIGKTTVTRQLIKTLAEQNTACYAIKPVTAGLEIDSTGEKYSEDARRINQFATVTPPISAIAPIQLSTPCSPHIAAHLDNVTLTAANIVQTIQHTLEAYPADVVLIEGAGGWFTPINDSETLADVAKLLEVCVIVVIGVKLGCLNHAILTIQAIQQAGLTVAGVVFNQLTKDTDYYQEQVRWLTQYLQLNYVSKSEKPVMFLQNLYII